ncbi:MAG: serine/threonine protein kinase/tetratricopeptide (TPR) repeat protein [Flavobacteriales bacterium]|jgi:serine/threonine protein kinase/tetratricopeptide (TPR) repeat protein
MDIEIPGYKLLRTLGKGGMATVYLAQQQIFEREIALKVMSEALAEDPCFGQRFFREAKIVSQLMHPNIVTVHDAGVHQGLYFLSMEYIDGQDLKYLRKKLNLPQKIQVIRDIAKALEYAGSKGFVHRDIKPENIMFRSADGSAVLTDFGIARAIETDLSVTQTGVAIGTPHYMSPEQAKGKPVDNRSDLYSLGVVFYLLLSGRVPYDGESAVTIGIKHITEPLPVLPPEMDGLQDILDQLLAKSPSNRFQNGGELLAELDAIDLDLLSDTPYEEGGGEFVFNEHDTAERELDHALAETEAFTLVFDSSEGSPKGTASFWSASVAIFFVIAVITTFIYVSRPVSLEPWIQVVEEQVFSSYQKASIFAKTNSDSIKAMLAERQANKAANGEVDGTNDSNKGVDVDIDAIIPAPERAVFDSEVEGGVQASGGVDSEPLQPAEATEVVGEEAVEISPEPVLSDEELAEIRLAELRAKIVSLRDPAAQDLGTYHRWLNAHYVLLTEFPQDSQTIIALVDAKDKEISRLMKSARRGESSKIESGLVTLKQNFIDMTAGEFTVYERQLRRELDISALRALGQQQFEHGELINPSGRNALQSFRNLKRLEPQNSLAIRRLTEISEILTERAQKSIDASKWQEARSVVVKALEADATNQQAHAMESRVREYLSQLRELDSAMVLAVRYREAGALYAPEVDNAYENYRRVLALSPSNQDAEKAIVELVDELSTEVWSLVSASKFSEAKTLLVRPRQLQPDSTRIKALSQAVEQVISDQQLDP